jgi:uncharacterized protein YbjT (DUF2867 family)
MHAARRTDVTARKRRTAGPILVTGGTGRLGRLVVDRLLERGKSVRVLSRHSEMARDGVDTAMGDLASGEGIDAAVDGVEVIVHCAGGQRGDDEKARHLVTAAARAGVGHIVYISVVGDERVPAASGPDHLLFGYFDSKLGAERVIAESGVPFTTLHATQFHELTLLVAKGMAKLPVIPVPAGLRFQPVDTAEVADRLVELALGEPAGVVGDFAGPKVYEMDELVRAYLRAAHSSKPIVRIPLPGKAARAIRAGAALAPDATVGKVTWEAFLAEHVAMS